LIYHKTGFFPSVIITSGLLDNCWDINKGFSFSKNKVASSLASFKTFAWFKNFLIKLTLATLLISDEKLEWSQNTSLQFKSITILTSDFLACSRRKKIVSADIGDDNKIVPVTKYFVSRKDFSKLINDPSIDVIVEVMGGVDLAKDIILQSLKLGKSVVTANKAVIARYGEEIYKTAAKEGVYILSEAAVCGGIPIIEPLKRSLKSNSIKKMVGIINGTTNFILSKMANEKADYKETLKLAQSLGYAEFDPTADVEGQDAADKISILSELAFGGKIKRDEIHSEGISNIKLKDIEYANKLGFEIKLLALSERQQINSNDSLALNIWVGPSLIPKSHPLAKV